MIVYIFAGYTDIGSFAATTILRSLRYNFHTTIFNNRFYANSIDFIFEIWFNK